MFLFDKHKSSRQLFSSGSQIIAVRWKRYLNTYPAYCAESTAAIDSEGNFYFGTHSGAFYSLNKNGEIRWVFITKKKIYGSPLLMDLKVIFAGGDGNLYALSRENGEILWVRNLKKGYDKNFKQKLLQTLIHLPYTFNWNRMENMDTKCWASPNLIDGLILVTGFGKGIYAFDEQGVEKWSYNFGFPRYQLCGVTSDTDNNIYAVSRSGHIYNFSISGNLIWKKKITNRLSSWGNPSYCMHSNQLYFVFSRGEKVGFIYAFNRSGKELWHTKLNGAIHGSVAISADGEYLYCCDFAGFLYKINAKNGHIIKYSRISTSVRALWTTPTIDSENNLYISTKDSLTLGRVLKYDDQLNEIWSFPTGKALSVPLILSNGDVCFGSWDGFYYCLKTKN